MNDNKNDGESTPPKVVDLFGKPIDTERSFSRHFEIVLNSGQVHLQEGYICVTPHFVAIVNQKGDVDFLTPMESLDTIRSMNEEEVHNLKIQNVPQEVA